MRVKFLTSSRADFGIYLPLLQKMSKDKKFEVELIVFGSHMSHGHGYTVEEVEQYGFRIAYKIESLVQGDTPQSITDSMALTMLKFSSVWEKEKDKTDLIVCLGDRYEMYAAVAASVSFGIRIAHLHGGETSLGAIDNILRHSISLMADIHFTSTPAAARKVAEVIGAKKNVFAVGALSLDKVEASSLKKKQFEEKFAIPLTDDTILVTFHPETMGRYSNEKFARIITEALEEVSNPVVITLPNADAEGQKIRRAFQDLGKKRNKTYVVDTLGAIGYFTAMKHCGFLLGNSSSGIIEAASFGKYVINLGNRQKGREAGKNVIHTRIEKKAILDTIKKLNKAGSYKGKNIYGDGNTADKIIKILKSLV